MIILFEEDTLNNDRFKWIDKLIQFGRLKYKVNISDEAVSLLSDYYNHYVK